MGGGGEGLGSITTDALHKVQPVFTPALKSPSIGSVNKRQVVVTVINKWAHSRCYYLLFVWGGRVGSLLQI